MFVVRLLGYWFGFEFGGLVFLVVCCFDLRWWLGCCGGLLCRGFVAGFGCLLLLCFGVWVVCYVVDDSWVYIEV